MVLVIDNYDSFTWNLVQYLGELGEQVEVRRNDEVGLADIETLAPRRLLISPGPCGPEQAGISVEAIRRFAGHIPILGVCLGHQAIAHAFGAQVVRATRVVHGKTSRIRHDGAGVFRGLPPDIEAGRYHSLAVSRPSLPDYLSVTASSEDGEVMGLRHRALPVEGVQFHPESVLTEHGLRMLANFLE